MTSVLIRIDPWLQHEEPPVTFVLEVGHRMSSFSISYPSEKLGDRLIGTLAKMLAKLIKHNLIIFLRNGANTPAR